MAWFAEKALEHTRWKCIIPATFIYHLILAKFLIYSINEGNIVVSDMFMVSLQVITICAVIMAICGIGLVMDTRLFTHLIGDSFDA